MDHEALHRIRASRNWPPEKMARLLRLPVATIHAMEQGQLAIPENLEYYILSNVEVPDLDADHPRVFSAPTRVASAKHRRKKRPSKAASMPPDELKYYRAHQGLTIRQATTRFSSDVKSPRAWANMEQGITPVSAGIELMLRVDMDERGIPAYTESKSKLTAAHLKAVRKKFGLTQAQAANLVKKSWRTWQNWETGKVPIPSWLLPKLRTLKLTKET